MNLALTAIILIILLLPGATILRAYYTSIKEKKSVIHLPFTEILFRGIVFSFLIHCCAICVLRISNVYVDFQLLYNILSGKEININNIDFTHSFLKFCLYSILLILMLFISTKIFKFIAQSKNWDINYHTLRNTNYWFQIFSARYLEGIGIQGEREKTDLIFLDILSEENILYSGFLLDFNYSPEQNKLENILLHSARKRILHLPEKKQRGIKSGKISRIPGDVLLIPTDMITNMNIYYMNFSTDMANNPISSI